jgi:octaprenyl-diphosphate synthase
VKKKHKNTAKVQELVKLVVDRGGLDYATEQMNVYRDRAIQKIMEFPETEARASLIELVNYVTTRKK